jgi:hypothetical protein
MKTTIVIEWQTGEPPKEKPLLIMFKMGTTPQWGYISADWVWTGKVYEDGNGGLEVPAEVDPDEIAAWAISPFEKLVVLETGEFVAE